MATIASFTLRKSPSSTSISSSKDSSNSTRRSSAAKIRMPALSTVSRNAERSPKTLLLRPYSWEKYWLIPKSTRKLVCTRRPAFVRAKTE